MSETTKPNLNGVAETLLITLYVRAMESQRPDALIKDEKAVALVTKMNYDFARIRQIKMDEDDKVVLVLRNRKFDLQVKDFLTRNPEAVVVHLGCGLDTRFERVDNGWVEWYDLDLPEVIDLRRKLIGDGQGRYHLLAASAFDPAWLDTLSVHRPRPFLFLAEGVLMYFEESQVKGMVLATKEHFPGAELVFDTLSPYAVRANNLRLAITKLGARYRWGVKSSRDIISWDTGICLLDEWFPFDQPEARLAHIQWMRHIPLFAKIMGIFHYRLGKQSEG